MKMLICKRCVNSLRSILSVECGFSTSLSANISFHLHVPRLQQLQEQQGLVRRQISQFHSWHEKKNELRNASEYTFKANSFARRCHSLPRESVYVWGDASTGALGIELQGNKYGSDMESQITPCRMKFVDTYYIGEHKPKPVLVAAGYCYSILVFDCVNGHRLLGSGVNTDLQLGYQKGLNKPGYNLDLVFEPSEIDLGELTSRRAKITGVSCGRAHTFIATDGEGVFSFGNNSHGQCGRTIRRDQPIRDNIGVKQIEFTEQVKQICCGLDHTLVLTDQGQVYSCGLGADGQTGLGHYGAVSELSCVQGDIQGEDIVYLSSKGDCVLAVSASGEVFGWGNSEYGQLACVAGDETQVNVSRHLPLSTKRRVLKVAAAGTMCALMDDEGDVYTWGYGALGRNRQVEQSDTPELIPRSLFGGSQLDHIDCGLNHLAALTNTGELYLWGNNRNGCLGVGDEVTKSCDQYLPNKVVIPGDVIGIACGVNHNIAICRS